MAHGQVTTREQVHDEAPPANKTESRGQSKEWSSDHPVDLRLTIPFVGGGFYFTLVAGRERRSKERRVEERRKHPLLRTGNILAMAFLSICLWLYLRMLWVSLTSIAG